MKIMSIGACLKTEDNPFWTVEVRKGLEIGAKDANVKLIYASPKKIDDATQQLQILRQFIKQQVDAIVLAPIVSKKIEDFVKHCPVPVIIIDTALTGAKHFIGFNDYGGGVESGTYLAQHLSKGAKVAVVEGPKKGSFTKRVDGFRSACQKHLDIVSVVSANFEEDTAHKRTKQLLTKYPDLAAIFYTSDNMAMGGLMAVAEMERSVLVSGFDATHAGMLAVKKGNMISTIDTQPERMGETAIQIALDIIHKKHTHKTTLLDVRLVTKKSIKQLPKEAVQKREYVLVDAKRNCTEFAYDTLKDSLECPIVFGKNYLSELPARLRFLDADKYLIITDSNIKKLYGISLKEALQKQNLSSELFSFPAGEKQKTFTTLNKLATQILDEGISKRTCLVVLGGGVVGNIAGFLAAILMRGIRFVHVPTTVMSQIDSTTGGKQAVNTEHGKNLLGTYYEPEFIYINPKFIQTLPIREYRSGVAEAIKHGLCQSKKLLQLTTTNKYSTIAKETIRLKVKTMSLDPREKHEGLVLVYGHTIGHVLEILSNHKLNHGEAVSLGMVAAVVISHKMEYCGNKLVALHKRILRDAGLPITIPKYIRLNTIEKALLYDKKHRQKEVEFILLEDVEKIKITHGRYSTVVPSEIIRATLKEMQKS